MRLLLGLGLLLLVGLAARAADDDFAAQAREAWQKGDRPKAVELMGKAIAADPKSATLYLIRGEMHAALKKSKEAVADITKAIQLDPKNAEAYDHRGSEQFKLGNVAESLVDFDKFIELQPQAANGHWKRGITLYYVGQYDKGRKQFNAYENVDTNDVENAVWHFLCNAKATSLEKARKEILKIGKDKRTPMMEVYSLFKGDLKPEDVLAAAESAEKVEGKEKAPLFYAHLYLGLYYDILGDKKKALEHMSQAAGKYRIGHYMGDVAQVHEGLLKKGKSGQ